MRAFKNCIKFAFLVLGFWMPLAQSFDYYAGIVPVNDRSQVSFRQGVNAALLQVLARISGETPEKLLQNSLLVDDLSNAERYTSQFLYKTQLNLSQKPQIYLQASFPEKMVMGLVKKGKLRFYAPHKTEVLLLPVYKDTGNARLEISLNELLVNAAQKSGVAVVMGGLQQEDASLIWSGDAVYMTQLANAYGKSMVATIQLVALAPITKGKWQLMEDGKLINSKDVIANGSAEFVEQGMYWLSSQFADKAGVDLGSKPSKMEIVVTGIQTYEQYEASLSYLKQISIVESLGLLKAEKDTLNITLNLSTAVEQFEKVIMAEKKFNIVIGDNGQKNYLWNE